MGDIFSKIKLHIDDRIYQSVGVTSLGLLLTAMFLDFNRKLATTHPLLHGMLITISGLGMVATSFRDKRAIEHNLFLGSAVYSIVCLMTKMDTYGKITKYSLISQSKWGIYAALAA